jgi:hypothetical protein
MEDDRNTQYQQSGEGQEEMPPADQVEVKERGLLDTLLGRKKAPAEDQENKQEEALVSGMEDVKVSEPEKHHEVQEDHEGGEKKESLLAKLHRTGSSSVSSETCTIHVLVAFFCAPMNPAFIWSSVQSSDEEEEVIDENGEVVKRKKKKKGLKEKLPGHKDHDVDGQHKPYTPAPVPTYQEEEHEPYVPTPAVEPHAYKEDDDHKAYIPAPKSEEPVTTTHVHHLDNATVVQKVEETPEKGLLDKIKEKLPGGHKKPEDDAAAPAPHAEDVSSPDGQDKEKKQGLLGKIMDKIPGYNKTPAEEEHNMTSAAGEHKTSSS